MTNSPKQTYSVSDNVFRAVYDSPAALPGRYKWLTSDEDGRKIEELLGMPPRTIGAPLWVSGDRKACTKCRREINWLLMGEVGPARGGAYQPTPSKKLGDFFHF